MLHRTAAPALCLAAMCATAVTDMPLFLLQATAMVKGNPANKRYSYSNISVTREGGPPAHLCMVTMHPDQTMFLIRGQLLRQLAPPGCSDSMIQRLLLKVSHACTLQASIPIMLKLKARHAIKPNASSAQLISMTTCKNMLKLLGADTITMDCLDRLTPAPAAVTLTVSPTAAVTSPQLNVTLPAMLPKGQYSQSDLCARYGLRADFASAKLLQLEPLQSQVQALHEWMTQPINLARGQQKYITEGTWLKGFQSIIHMYLGFCHRFRAVPQPSLEHFLDGQHLTAYADFLIQRVSPIH